MDVPILIQDFKLEVITRMDNSFLNNSSRIINQLATLQRWIIISSCLFTPQIMQAVEHSSLDRCFDALIDSGCTSCSSPSLNV